MSSQFSTCYGRRTRQAIDASFLSRHPGLDAQKLTLDGPFVALWNEPEAPPFPEDGRYLGLEASQAIGEAIVIGVQANVGFFLFEHSRDGSLRRRLAYNFDGGWLRSEGEAEEWESQAFFSDADLARTLGAYDAEDHGRIRELWQTKWLVVGELLPAIDPEEVCAFLRQRLGLP
jgi:hypothetical protein